MRIIDFEWDEWNSDHILDHDVEMYEAEEVFANRPFIRKVKEEKYIAFGQSNAGRYLTVVFAYRGQSRAYIVTARDSNWKETRHAKNKGK